MCAFQGFTIEEADKPDTYYQTPRQVLEEEFDVRTLLSL